MFHYAKWCICVIETFIKIEISFQKFLWCSSSVLSLQANVFLAFFIIDSFCLFSNFIGIHIHTNDKVYALCIRLLEFSIIITRLILPVCVSSFFYIGGGVSCVYSIFLLTDIWTVFRFEQLWIELLQTFSYKSFCGHKF